MAKLRMKKASTTSHTRLQGTWRRGVRCSALVLPVGTLLALDSRRAHSLTTSLLKLSDAASGLTENDFYIHIFAVGDVVALLRP